MQFTIFIILAIAAYFLFCLLLARCMGINDLMNRAQKWPKYPKHPVNKPFPTIERRKKGRDRRQRQAPIVYDFRQQDRRSGWLVANQRGAVAIILAVLMGTVLMPFLALALDYGGAHVRKTEMAAAADAVALGAASALYPSGEPRPAFSEPSMASAVANELASLNGATCTHELGHFNLLNGTFTPGALGNIPDWETVTLTEMYQDTFFTNAAQVTCSVTAHGILSQHDFEVIAHAIAVHRMEEAPEGETGVIMVPGSALVQ